ncbi:hypothetical protein AJ85_07520 [Alkalihalobacillus alcalophilus ATCC 27647 = CGMCC 1.3604]|uniref:Uncharacterized protein n=1 Tax=Alkalihalobacillus alcalophilus ATCC 27647 = CGMCC 1.3604 TaxID=1218173 RepID=A0A4S4K0F1_ALKAL|nr:hypothetical protein AJ85_07520 [Alkalihalobacillus alcalophilus ATCC 27647 = CGMCC 1.3604]
MVNKAEKNVENKREVSYNLHESSYTYKFNIIGNFFYHVRTKVGLRTLKRRN